MSRTTVDVSVGGRRLRLSSLDRVLFPATGFTKRQLVDYYVAVAAVVLPHVADRPLTLHRFPEGVGGPQFFQTRVPPHPEWLRTVTLTFPRTGKTFATPVIDDVAGLVWAANLSTIELHPFLGATHALDRPLLLVFDLDPGPPAGLREVAELALRLRQVLADLGLVPYVKSSGRKGLHVVAPLDGSATYAVTKRVAHQIAAALAADDPAHVVDRMTRELRPGKVFVDWSQNDPGKSTVAPYSLRGGPVPTVAAPLWWDEVATAATSGDVGRLVLSPDAVHARLDGAGDPFAGLLGDARPLLAAAGR